MIALEIYNRFSCWSTLSQSLMLFPEMDRDGMTYVFVLGDKLPTYIHGMVGRADGEPNAENVFNNSICKGYTSYEG